MAAVEDEHVRELLEVAINGEGSSRRFSDAPVRYTDERETSFRWKGDKVKGGTLEWLESKGSSLEYSDIWH